MPFKIRYINFIFLSLHNDIYTKITKKPKSRPQKRLFYVSENSIFKYEKIIFQKNPAIYIFSMKSNAKKMKTEIFYNGSCSICAPEIRMYKKIITNENVEGSNQLDFVDISVSVPDEFSQEDMLKRLHAKLPNGDIVSGVPAFIALWKQVPGFKGLAFLINLPIIKSVAIFTYDKILAPTLYKRYVRSVKNQNQCDT